LLLKNSMDTSPHETNYRWYILALAALTHTFAAAIPSMCLPVLFKEIAEDLGLDLVQVGILWGLGALPGIATALLGGVIGDRFGARRTLAVICLLAGLSGALRGVANDFFSFGAIVFLSGLLTPMIPMNVHKTCGIWFSRRQLGLANGVVSMGMALGFTIASLISATILSPWLGGWRNVLFFYGAITVAISLPWYLARPAPRRSETSSGEGDTKSMRQAVLHTIRIKNVWLLGLALLGISGCVQGTLGYLPLYLRGIGWPPASADGALAAFHTMSMMFVIPIALWADKLGSRKNVLMMAALMIITGVGLLTVVDGLAVWLAVGIAGLVRDGFMAVFMTMIIETKGVGAAYAGTAVGLVMIFSGLGSLIAPPLGNSLAQFAPALPFLLWTAMTIGGMFGLYFTQERRVASAPVAIG